MESKRVLELYEDIEMNLRLAYDNLEGARKNLDVLGHTESKTDRVIKIRMRNYIIKAIKQLEYAGVLIDKDLA